MSPFAYWNNETKWGGLRLGTRRGTPLPHVMLGLRVLLTEPRNVPLLGGIGEWLFFGDELGPFFVGVILGDSGAGATGPDGAGG